MSDYDLISVYTPTNDTVPVTLSTISLYDNEQKTILRAIAIALSSISLIAGAVMFYWYLRLRRKTFRHTLILSLIISDILRSILEFIYPVVTLSNGDVTAESLYCKIGGFFTAWFFESSDLMIFIIAIHTAVYVFNPKLTQSGDEGGLWRWRYYVFAAWFLIPALLAGLAFIDPTPYVPLVTWCYLPARPLVLQYALAWGPRYFIFLLISVLYVALYVYVRRAYRTIDETHRDSLSSDTGSDLEAHRSHNTNIGHIPQAIIPGYLQRKRPSIPPPLVEDEKESQVSTEPSESESPSPTSETPMVTHPPPTYERPPQSAEARNMSLATTLSDALPPSFRASRAQEKAELESFAHRRSRVQRQMNTLFIFPIVYFIMWIPPFIHHLYQVITFDSTANTLPPGTFAVTVLATIFLPAQGFVNVCVYAVRERPWRQRRRPATVRNTSPQKNDMTRPHSFADWRGFTEPNQAQLESQVAQAMQTYAYASNATLAAYARRDLEWRERELARATQAGGEPTARTNWWDTQADTERKRRL